MSKFYYMLILACLICGCETVGAFGTGRMNSGDVYYITHAGTIGRKTTPLNLEGQSNDTEEELEAQRNTNAWKEMSKADDWLEDNLW